MANDNPDYGLLYQRRFEKVKEDLFSRLQAGETIKVSSRRRWKAGILSGKLPWNAANALVSEGRAVVTKHERERIKHGPKPHNKMCVIMTIALPKDDAI